MQVEIVQKSDKQKMTLEELALQDFIGMKTTLEKYPMCTCAGKYSFVKHNIGYTEFRENKIALLEYCQSQSAGTFHIFDTAKELYLWMAE